MKEGRDIPKEECEVLFNDVCGFPWMKTFITSDPYAKFLRIRTVTISQPVGEISHVTIEHNRRA